MLRLLSVSLLQKSAKQILVEPLRYNYQLSTLLLVFLSLENIYGTWPTRMLPNNECDGHAIWLERLNIITSKEMTQNGIVQQES